MDTITHSLAGALVGYALGSERKKYLLPAKKSMLCGAIAAAFPDSDYITALIDPLLFITYWHRGITHSIVMLPIWALLLGVLIALLLKQRHRWKAYVTVSAAALISHIALDAITTWDLQIFAPLSDVRISLQYAFVIDPIISTLLFVALICAYFLRAHWISLLGITTVTVYIFALSILQYNAVDIAQKAAQDRLWKSNHITALPQPFSPFHWKLIVSDTSGHRLAFVNLVADSSSDKIFNANETFLSIPNYYRPKHDLEWMYFSRIGEEVESVTVWNHPKFRLFRKFAHYPAASPVNTSTPEDCFWFLDLRFLLPVMETPFQYGMCRNPNDKEDWLLYRLNNFSDQEFTLVAYGQKRAFNLL